MPKSHLAAFLSFARTLLPHQVSWLMKSHQLRDAEKKRILQILHHNLYHPENIISFPAAIDKRKYSYIKRWVPERLNSIDVDAFYLWLCEMDKTDQIFNNKMHMIPQSGHFVQFESYDEFNRVVMEFLGE